MMASRRITDWASLKLWDRPAGVDMFVRPASSRDAAEAANAVGDADAMTDSKVGRPLANTPILDMEADARNSRRESLLL
jgi:hypothetical protein